MIFSLPLLINNILVATLEAPVDYQVLHYTI